MSTAASAQQTLRAASSRFPAFAWAVLVYNIAVILWGALVRATGSGAGCGGHWPLCNGDVLPAIAQAATRIEFTHRMMSGVALISVVILPVWAAKAYAKTHPARRWAVWSLVFMLTEALLGAALVLLGYVAKDQSTGRVVSLSLHLVNTFTLLACLTMTAWWSNRAEQTIARTPWNGKAAIVALVVISMAGAITALGDTLFPSASLAEGVRADFSAQASFLIRLRIIHPVLAALTALYLVSLAVPELRLQRMKKIAAALLGLAVLQLVVGGLSVLLRAPLSMQLLHLLVADSLWLALIVFTCEKRWALETERHRSAASGI